MKIFRFIAFAVLGLSVTASLSSCSDDDDNGSGSSKDFIGTWQSEWRTLRTIKDGEVTYENDGAYTNCIVEFYDDGTYYLKKGGSGAPFYQASGYYDGEWSYKNGTLKTIWGGNEISNYKVTRITPAILEMEYTDYNDKRHETEYTYTRFVKISE